MVNREVPDDVAQLLSIRLGSAAELEVLLFLNGRPCAEWTGNAVADLLLLERADAEAILKRLHAAGFLTVRHRPQLLYQYAPESEALRHTVGRLATLHAQHPLLAIGLAALPSPRPGSRRL